MRNYEAGCPPWMHNLVCHVVDVGPAQCFEVISSKLVALSNAGRDRRLQYRYVPLES